MVTLNEKQELKKEIVACLKGDKDIRKVVIFGSFVTSDESRDIDVPFFRKAGKDIFFEAIHQLMTPPEKPKKKIGYRVKEKRKRTAKKSQERTL